MSLITDFSIPLAEGQEHSRQPLRGRSHQQNRVTAFATIPELVRGFGYHDRGID
jgi:hypothetical protein